MAPVVVDPGRIRSFKNAKALEDWYRKNHDSTDELWLRVFKKGSDVESVSIGEALDAALCWGWIDGIRKGFDEKSFLQRYTRRRGKSIWSRINVDNVARLVEEGRMTEHGLREVEAAKADGRWDRAYGGSKDMQVPDDLLAAIEAEPKAKEMLGKLSAQNRFALAFRLHHVRTEAGRRKKIADFVAMLARGETVYPQKTK